MYGVSTQSRVVPIQNSESSVKRRTGIFKFSDYSTQQPKASLFFSMPSYRRNSGSYTSTPGVSRNLSKELNSAVVRSLNSNIT